MTCKIDNNCTCEVKLLIKDDEEVSVSVCKTHYGHSKKLGHTWLPRNKREEIAAKLQQGIYKLFYKKHVCMSVKGT